ncbi:hypothetical protein [Cognatishimia sp.]|uniref:hypothetical protein n=2 Tax=Cognatishimia sp. TaxID=2211648 RepID=UPI00355A2D6E
MVNEDPSTYSDHINGYLLALVYYLFSTPSRVADQVQDLAAETDMLVFDLALGGGIGHGQMFAQFFLTAFSQRLSSSPDRIDYHGTRTLGENPVLSSTVQQSAKGSIDIQPWLWRTQKGLSGSLAAFNEIVERRFDLAFGANATVSAPIVVYPYALPSDLMGFARWLTKCALPEKGITLVVGLLFNDFLADDQPQRDLAISALREAFETLNAHPLINLAVFSEVDAVNAMVVDFGVPEKDVFLLPFLPSLRFEHGVEPAKLSRPRPRVGIIGTCRPSRGHHHILSAVEEIAHEDIDVLMHASESNLYWFERSQSEPKESFEDQLQRLEREGKLSWIREPLSHDKYDKALLSLDAMILPYDPKFYKDTGSGVAFEAVAARRHLILSADCAFAGILGRVGYPHTLIHDLSGSGVLDAIRRAKLNAAVLDQALARWDNADLLFSEVDRFTHTLKHSLTSARET